LLLLLRPPQQLFASIKEHGDEMEECIRQQDKRAHEILTVERRATLSLPSDYL
jgi:hypothetical protein